MIEQSYLSADVRGLFADAVRHHQSGQRAEADRLYRQVLHFDPRHADSLHLLGVIAHQDGRHEVAVEWIKQAIAINSDVADYRSNLGVALKQLGRLEDAVAHYCAALTIKPDYPEAHFNRGNALHDLGRFDDAVAAYGTALRVKPDYAEASANLGIALNDLGRPEAAVAAIGDALRVNPDYAEAHCTLGNALKELGRLTDAIVAYRTALRIRPDHAQAHSNLGNVLDELGRPTEAVVAYRAALSIKPDFAETHYNLGHVLNGWGRLDEAIVAYATALRIKPDYVEACSNLGNTLKDLGRPGEAVVAYRAALRIKPDYAQAHSNLGIALLLVGRFEEGWPAYEWRSHAQDLPLPTDDFRQTLWQGEALEGKTILLRAEQGMGDVLQFCRYVPLVAARGGRVVLEVYRPLLRLLGGLNGMTRIVAQGDALPRFDVHCRLLSLPGVFGTTLESIPPPPSGLAVDRQRVQRWQAALPTVGRRVGIVWQGNPSHPNDRHRSVPLACFAPLARRPDVHLISLQKQHGLDQLTMLPEGMAVRSLGPDYADGDFAETAAVLAALDLVVTIDTAIAHLAGTMGRPVWLALPIIPDWRWMLGRDDTPWYPSMRLFRQSKRGDWSTVFERMAAALADSRTTR